MIGFALCCLGVHEWTYRGARVRPPDCNERDCLHCGRREFWADVAWMGERP